MTNTQNSDTQNSDTVAPNLHEYTESVNSDRTSGDWQQVVLWRTGSGQLISRVHPPDKCVGTHCSVHNPSDHHMREWPTHLRGSGPMDLGIFTERICEHDVGHPDPDDPFAPASHGCDGCCAAPEAVDDDGSC